MDELVSLRVQMSSPISTFPDMSKFIDDDGKLFAFFDMKSIKSTPEGARGECDIKVPRKFLAKAVHILENDLFGVSCFSTNGEAIPICLQRQDDIFEIWVTDDESIQCPGEEFHAEPGQRAFRFCRADLFHVFQRLKSCYTDVVRLRNVTLDKDIQLQVPLMWMISF